MFEKGVVDEVDAEKLLARVLLPERGEDFKSWWLSVVQPCAGENRSYRMPDIGDKVLVVFDRNMEDGWIFGSYYTEQDTPPVTDANKYHLAMKDEASFEYDRNTHKASIVLPAEGTLEIAAPKGVSVVVTEGAVTLEAKKGGIILDATDGGGKLMGDWEIDKGLKVGKALDVGEGIKAKNDIDTDGNVKGGGTDMAKIKSWGGTHGHTAMGSGPPTPKL